MPPDSSASMLEGHLPPPIAQGCDAGDLEGVKRAWGVACAFRIGRPDWACMRECAHHCHMAICNCHPESKRLRLLDMGDRQGRRTSFQDGEWGPTMVKKSMVKERGPRLAIMLKG